MIAVSYHPEPPPRAKQRLSVLHLKFMRKQDRRTCAERKIIGLVLVCTSKHRFSKSIHVLTLTTKIAQQISAGIIQTFLAEYLDWGKRWFCLGFQIFPKANLWAESIQQGANGGARGQRNLRREQEEGE